MSKKAWCKVCVFQLESPLCCAVTGEMIHALQLVLLRTYTTYNSSSSRLLKSYRHAREVDTRRLLYELSVCNRATQFRQILPWVLGMIKMTKRIHLGLVWGQSVKNWRCNKSFKSRFYRQISAIKKHKIAKIRPLL